MPEIAPAPPAPVAPVSKDPKAGAREAFIEITSEPAGAYILVNDQLVGPAPRRLAIKVTAQGFCADYVAIKARFVAKDSSQLSQTIEAELTPREKAPVALVFTPQGVQRRLR